MLLALKAIVKVIKEHKLTIIIAIIFFILPFFWLKPGEMDLGGDDTRLFFYDPIAYLKNANLYDVSSVGKGAVMSSYYYIPYVALIALVNFFISSTYIISGINGLKLAGAFIAIYLIAYELVKNVYAGTSRKIIYASAILAGIFYVASLGSIHVNFDWETALSAHNQVFLSPLIFYFLLKFFLTQKYKFLWIALLISFIFAPNFGLGAYPSFFAFYPLAFLFLICYAKFFSKRTIPWRRMFIGFLLFLGIHAFHLLSQAYSLFDSSSYINNRVFSQSSAQQEGMDYFTAVSSSGMASLNLLLPSKYTLLRWASFVSPAIIVVGFILNRKKEFLFISLFFLLTLFLTTANITHIGFEFYKSLFYIPAFSMFRVFFVKWMYVFLFFYALLFGFAVYSIISNLKPFYAKMFSCFVLILLIITGIPLFMGLPIRESIVRGSNNVKTSFTMDPIYEQALQFVRSLPDDGKILVTPITDFYLQVIYGKYGGAYSGPSTFDSLTTKYSFAGSRDFGWESNDPAPYSEELMKYAREKNYDRLLRIFITLNIRYIFHNTDPRIYEKSFTTFSGPYPYMMLSLPATQQGYIDFIHHFPVHQIYNNGPYVIYEIDKSSYNSTIFIPEGVYQSDKLSFDADKVHSVFINDSTCNKEELGNLCKGGYEPTSVNISFRMINPILYEVIVKQKEPVDSMLLVMQHTFNKGWKLVIDGKNVPENQHISVNGYANGWFLAKKDFPDKQNYTLFIKLDSQKYFWYGSSITIVSLLVVIALLMYSLIHRQNGNS